LQATAENDRFTASGNNRGRNAINQETESLPGKFTCNQTHALVVVAVASAKLSGSECGFNGAAHDDSRDDAARNSEAVR